jgi:hypothetical protein
MISYSVNATRPIGTVEMMTPATGTNEQRNTNTDKNPTPETCKTRRPKAVKAVFTTAMALCACIAFPKIAPKVPICKLNKQRLLSKSLPPFGHSTRQVREEN